MTLAKLLNSYILDISSTYGCMGLMWCLHELTYEDHLKECLSCSKCSINISSLPFYQTSHIVMLGEAHCPPWPGTTVTICISCFTTGGSGKEHGTNNPPPTGRVWERSKWDTICPTTSQNPSLWHSSWLNKACTTRKNSWVRIELEWLAEDNPETNSITIKPQTASHVTELFSWVPLPYCSPSGCPFPNKISCFVSTCVSSDNLFPSVRQAPSFGPWKGSPFLQQ